MAQNDTQTDTQTHGHGDSKTNSAKRAELVKIKKNQEKKNICDMSYFMCHVSPITCHLSPDQHSMLSSVNHIKNTTNLGHDLEFFLDLQFFFIKKNIHDFYFKSSKIAKMYGDMAILRYATFLSGLCISMRP